MSLWVDCINKEFYSPSQYYYTYYYRINLHNQIQQRNISTSFYYYARYNRVEVCHLKIGNIPKEYE